MVATRQVTIAEFQMMPLEGVWELVDGEPIEMTPTAGRSGWISNTIAHALTNHVRSTKLAWVFSAETGFVLFSDRQTVRSPDVALVLRERLESPPDSFVPLAPDLAVEVLSPTDRMAEALGKVAMYLEAGVRLVWLVDPESRTVNVFTRDKAPRMLKEGDTLSGDTVLPGFALPISEIFG
jgi:Uma2 family endonuclease